MKKHSLKERFQYWLENKLSNNPLSFIKIIAFSTLILALLVACFIKILNLSDSSFLSEFWDTLASSINAWMPFSEDVDNNVGHIILTSIAAIFGLFITSLLIGIISNSLEEKIEQIKKGNSIVIEENHIVILGFIEGEYTLIKELVKSIGTKEACIVVACDKDKNDVEEMIESNVTHPENIRIVCRTVESITPTSLSCCSIETCKAIIINPTEDEKVIKYIFTLTHMLNLAKREDVIIVATIRNKEFSLPFEFNKGKNIIFLVLSDFIARIIARTCTQPGLSLAYLELFNNKGSELYAYEMPETIGISFIDVLCNMKNGVPIGVLHNDNSLINPNADYIIQKDDKLIIFAEDNSSAFFVRNKLIENNIEKVQNININYQKILILGYNESFKTIIDEMPNGYNKVILAGIENDNYDSVKKAIKGKKNYKLLNQNISIDEIDSLEKLVKNVDRVVLLNNHFKSGDSADIKIMLRLTKLREIRDKNKLNFTICVELRRAANRTLIHQEDFTDYVVRTNMFSMFLAQLVSNPELKAVYDELLSNKGNEIKLLLASNYNIVGLNTSQIRNLMFNYGYLYLGIIKQKNGKYNCSFNPELDETLEIDSNDRIVVIGNTNDLTRFSI